MSPRPAAIDAALECLRKVAESSGNHAQLRANKITIGAELDELQTQLQILIKTMPDHARDIEVQVMMVDEWQGDIEMADDLEAVQVMKEIMNAWRDFSRRLKTETKALRDYLVVIGGGTVSARARQRDVVSLPLRRRADTG